MMRWLALNLPLIFYVTDGLIFMLTKHHRHKSTFFRLSDSDSNSELPIPSSPFSLTNVYYSPPAVPAATDHPSIVTWKLIMTDANSSSDINSNSQTKSNLIDSATQTLTLLNLFDSLTPSDLSTIENEYWENLLLPSLSYLPPSDLPAIKLALTISYHSHKDQRRKSGEPYIMHPVNVALLLSELKMNDETLIAGLLHDTVEDTDLTFAQVSVTTALKVFTATKERAWESQRLSRRAERKRVERTSHKKTGVWCCCLLN